MNTMPKVPSVQQPIPLQKTDPTKLPLQRRKTLDNAVGVSTDSTNKSIPTISPNGVAQQSGELIHSAMALVSKDSFTPFFASVMLKLALANAPVSGQVAVPRTGTRQAHGGDIRTADGSSGTRLPDGADAISEQLPIVPTPNLNKFLSDRIGRQEMLGMRAPPPPPLPLPVKTAAFEKKAVLAFIRSSRDKGAALSLLCRNLRA